jgi:hypothetical protein
MLLFMTDASTNYASVGDVLQPDGSATYGGLEQFTTMSEHPSYIGVGDLDEIESESNDE